VHHCLNHLKKIAGKGTLPVEDEVVASSEQLQVPPAVVGKLEDLDDRKRIHEILEQLPDTLRIPLVMCDMDDLSYEEIAHALGIGLSAVKMRIKRAREQFRRSYQRTASMAEGARG
jgi:RNA polymerase sigma-70 factor (ECF subfamily)